MCTCGTSTSTLYHIGILYLNTGVMSAAHKYVQQIAKSYNKQAEPWKTTIDLLCLNREGRHAEVGKMIRFICTW